MGDDKPPTEDETKVKERFKGWMTELLDEREAKRQADDDAERAAEDAKRVNAPATFLQSLFGK